MVRGGSIIGYTQNHIRHTKDYSYFKRSTHAEAALLAKYGEDAFKSSKLLIYRFNRADKNKTPRQSIPCCYCSHVLAATKLSKIIFLDENNNEKYLHPIDLKCLPEHPYYWSQRPIGSNLDKRY